jgi:hypothetical protein
MSWLLRLFLFGSLAVVAALLVVRPRGLRRYGRRLEIVAYAYVAAILISAALRLFGVVDWS